MKIAFIWQGLNGRYGKWQDGLYAAMQLIEKEHEVKYFDFPLEGIHEFKPDVVLYWEAPCTIRGQDAENYKAVMNLPYKKCLLFAGGPLKAIDVRDFDLVFVESKINEEDCEREGIAYRRAFGVNTSLFKPEKQPKIYDAFLQATFADWKRHQLFSEAVGEKGAVAGRLQEHDRNGYNACRKHKVTIFDELPAKEINSLINSSYCVLNTSEYWGGGQRCTLEAMASGVPVIVMADSPKNREYVEESGGGIVCEPNAEEIKKAIETIKQGGDWGERGLAYIKNKWTEYHYATALLNGIKSL